MNNDNNTNNNAFSMHDDGNHNINENVVVPPVPEDTYSKTEILDVTAIMRTVDASNNSTPAPTGATNTVVTTPSSPQPVPQAPVPPVQQEATPQVEAPKIVVPIEPVVYDELTGVALHEDTNGLEGTMFKDEPVVEEPVVKEKKPKTPLFYGLLFAAILLVVIAVVFGLLFTKSSIEQAGNDKGKKYYFYKAGTITYGDTNPEGYDVTYTYECNGKKCLVDVFSSDSKYPYAVIYDDGYYVFDYINGNIFDLKLKEYGYDIKNGKTSLLAIDDKNRLKGFIITTHQNNDVVSCYYSINKKKIVYQTAKWMPYTDSNIMYFINNSYISLYQEVDGNIKSKLIDFKSGIELGEIVGYYSAYYDAIRRNWYIVAKESADANSKIKLLKDDRLSYVLPTVQEYQYVGFNTNDKNIVYLTGDNQVYYVCDANAGSCVPHNTTSIVYDVIDDTYKIVKYNNQYAIMKNNSSPIGFRDYSDSDELLFDHDTTTFYKGQESLSGETGVHIFFKGKNAEGVYEDCLEYYFDETQGKVVELSNTCKKK